MASVLHMYGTLRNRKSKPNDPCKVLLFRVSDFSKGVMNYAVALTNFLKFKI